MSEDDLVKLTVYLTPRAHASMKEAAAMAGDTSTDTVNRALNVYALFLRAWRTEGRGTLVFEVTSGEYARVEIAPRT